MKYVILSILVAALLLENVFATGQAYKQGRNDYTMQVEGVTREFIVYVPTTYSSSEAIPVVFMFHGTGGNGEKFYNISGWKEKAEAENFLAVFPTAFTYVIKTNGQRRKKTKWNGTELVNLVAPGTELKDDVLFTRKMLATLNKKFSIDKNRIYASGFSNGGGFVLSRLATEMTAEFAAVSTVASGLEEALPVHGDQIPVFSIWGETDPKILAINGGNLIPMDPAMLVADPYLGGRIESALTTYELKDSYKEKLTSTFTSLLFDQSTSGNNNILIFSVIKGLQHRYPNGANNPAGVVAVDLFWRFFSRYVKS